MEKRKEKAELEIIIGELKYIENKIGDLEIKQEELRDRYYELTGEQYEGDYRSGMFED